jgi:hypothetical protein
VAFFGHPFTNFGIRQYITGQLCNLLRFLRMSFPPGIVRISAEFRDSTNALVDPTTVVFKVITPDDSVAQIVANVKDSTGKYHSDVFCASPGPYFFQAVGSGSVTAAIEGSFTVDNHVAEF